MAESSSPEAVRRRSLSETVLEGYLFKQGSRSRQFWHERYFVFTADGTLKYYTHNPKKEFDSVISANGSVESQLQPKGVYEIPHLLDCNVSELYVAKHQKQLMYCIKLTWAADNPTDSSVGSNFPDDNSSKASEINYGNRSEANSPSYTASERKVYSPEEAAKFPPRALLSRSSSAASASTPKMIRKTFQRLKQRTPSKRSSGNSLISELSSSGGSVNGPSASALGNGTMKHRATKSDGNLLRSLALSPLQEEQEDSTLHSGGRSEIPTTVEWSETEECGENQAEEDDNGNGNNDDLDANSMLLNAMHPPLENESMRSVSTVASVSQSRLHLSRQVSASQEELDYLQQQYLTSQKAARHKNRKLMMQGGKLAVATGAAVGLTVVTAGVSLVAGLALLGAGAVAGGGAAGITTAWKPKIMGEIVIAGPDFETMKMWKACLDASRESAEIKQSRWGQLFVSDGRKPALLPQIFDNPIQADNRMNRLGQGSCWRPIDGGWSSLMGIGTQGLRVFREECPTTNYPGIDTRFPVPFAKRPATDSPCPPVKALIVMNTSPLDTFLCLMSYNRMTDESSRAMCPNSEQISSFRLIANIDEHSDIIHLVFRPFYLFPSWTVPRDYCLFRYWRLEQDGSYIVCYESMQHPSCPIIPGYVRGEMHQVVTIAPQKKSYRRKIGSNVPQDCLMTTVAQVDPKGWVPVTPLSFLSHQSHADAFGVAALWQMIDIRDAIDQDRFLPVNIDDADRATHAKSYKRNPDLPPAIMRNRSLDSYGADETVADDMDYDFSFCQQESMSEYQSTKAYPYFVSHPPCTPLDKWAEPDPNSFRVRGPTYLKDHVKINAGPSIGRLLCADVVTVAAPIYTGMSVHPTERIQRALREEERLLRLGRPSPLPPFVFVVNIVLPGPPFYHGVFYYAVDNVAQIDGTSGTPASALCRDFFFGDSDEFRDRTFKMIPQIVEGNFLVKKAVGSTPAIMGKKLRQLYVRDDEHRRFFEVILDCGSSQVATGVIRLSLGYAATLVVDMGFLFEADDEATLPERLFGAVRMKYPEFSPRLRRVEPPPPPPAAPAVAVSDAPEA